MPSNTFFRLPEEKRQRLLNAAWEEFSRVSFADASINQIIHAANISRGSFYQYFTDKEDLTAYMLGEMRHYFSKLMWDILAEVEGDLFRAVVIAFERFLDRSGITDPVLAKLIHIIQLNPGIDFHRFMCSSRDASEREIFQHVSNRNYRSQDREFVGNVFFHRPPGLCHDGDPACPGAVGTPAGAAGTAAANHSHGRCGPGDF